MSETDGEVQVGTFGCYGETVKSSLHKITMLPQEQRACA